MSSHEGPIESLSAVTLVTQDMRRSVRFYRALGFALLDGGERASFTTFAAGGAALNLVAAGTPRPEGFWARVIFHVEDVDALYERACASGFEPSTRPRDAPWGERFFHLADPDGHELSFARPLEAAS